MAKKTGLVGGLVNIAVAIHKENERQKKLAIQEQNRRIREQKRLIAEAERLERERIRNEKEAERERKRQEKQRALEAAEQARLQTAYASLEDRYHYAKTRHNEILTLLSKPIDDSLCIQYCQEDINLLPLLYDYATRTALLEEANIFLPSPISYLLLSMAQERIGDIPHAIQTCKDALEMGISHIENVSIKERINLLTQSRNKE